MTNPTARWYTLLFDLLPFYRHDFALTHDGFQIFELILKLTGVVPASEIINTFKDGIAHS